MSFKERERTMSDKWLYLRTRTQKVFHNLGGYILTHQIPRGKNALEDVEQASRHKVASRQPLLLPLKYKHEE